MLSALRQIWTNPYVRVLLGLAALIALYFLLSWTRAVWGTFLIAYLIAFLLHPMVSFFEARGLGRWMGMGSVLGAVLLLLGMLWLIGLNLVSQLTLIIAELPTLFETLEELPFLIARRLDPSYGDTFQSAYGNLAQLLERVRNDLLPSLAGARENLIGRLLTGGNGGLKVAAVLVLSMMLLYGFRRYTRAFFRAVPPRYRRNVAELMSRLGFAIGGYVRGQLVVAAAVGLLTGVGLWLIGVPLAAALGLLTAIGNLIPFVGPLLAAAPALLLAFIESPLQAVLTGVLLLAVQTIDGNVLTPLVFSHMIDVDPVTVLASVVVGALLFGLWGALAAVPAAVFLTLLYKDYYLNSRWYRGEETLEDRAGEGG